jgi:hypothetical protein
MPVTPMHSHAVAAAGRRPADQQGQVATRTWMPAEVSRQGTSLLNQQFWLWGRDIRRSQGNILLEFGFTKHAPPAGVRVPSRYELTIPDHGRLTLWGFGLFFAAGNPDGLYLSRMKLAPLLSSAPGEIWEPNALPAGQKPATPEQWVRGLELLVLALRWMAGYERWIIDLHGAAYRQECLDAWHRSTCQPGETANRWLRLARLTHASLDRGLRLTSASFDLDAPDASARVSAG